MNRARSRLKSRSDIASWYSCTTRRLVGFGVRVGFEVLVALAFLSALGFS